MHFMHLQLICAPIFAVLTPPKNIPKLILSHLSYMPMALGFLAPLHSWSPDVDNEKQI